MICIANGVRPIEAIIVFDRCLSSIVLLTGEVSFLSGDFPQDECQDSYLDKMGDKSLAQMYLVLYLTVFTISCET